MKGLCSAYMSGLWCSWGLIGTLIGCLPHGRIHGRPIIGTWSSTVGRPAAPAAAGAGAFQQLPVPGKGRLKGMAWVRCVAFFRLFSSLVVRLLNTNGRTEGGAS